MPLFWIVHEIDGARVVRIQQGGALIFARLNALIDDFGGAFVEAHALDEKNENSEGDGRAHAHGGRSRDNDRPAGMRMQTSGVGTRT
jgi:hypothetical protein